jgi:manganese/zinc-transporting P-type ATPase C
MTTILAQRVDFCLLSSIPGRQRWSVPAILNRPRYALAVQIELEQTFGRGRVQANPKTGRILVESEVGQEDVIREGILARALEAEPVSKAVAVAKRDEDQRPGKARKLISKLLIGGAKLVLIFANRVIWGSIAASPVAVPLTVLSIAGTFITGYDFLRALVFTVTGRSRITTGTLIGAATLSSLMLRENVTALIVLWLLNLGEYLEMLTLGRTRRAIRQLLSTEEDEVWLSRDGVGVSVRMDVVQPGDLVIVRAGRRIAVDGIIEDGRGYINEAPISGESMPVLRQAGDEVYAGTILLSESIRIRVSGVGSDTIVGRLIQRVEEAQSLRPRIQTIGDAFAKRVVPSSFAAALLVFLVTRDPRRALTMMLVACPCAAGLATPTAVSASIGNGARRGILIKGGTHLEAMAEIDTVCFDKTGTLTESRPAVTRIAPLDGYTESRVLQLAVRAERHSQHPLAVAVLERASRDCELEHQDMADINDDFEILAGRGVRSWNGNEEILVGNERLLDEYGIVPCEQALALQGKFARHVETRMYVVHQRTVIGVIAVMAPVRAHAAQSITRLKRAGVGRLVMLTGDAEPVAAAVAQAVGVNEWRSRRLPEDKFEAIRDLRAEGRRVAMVGDGINDAPALALADVGIAMGTAGSDVAIETADVALAGDDLLGLSSAISISRQTMSVVRQNYGLALGTNSIGLYLAAMGSINPIIAAVLHNLSTILVIANSTRLIRFDPVGRTRNWDYRTGSGLQKGNCSESEHSDCCTESWTAHAEGQKFKEQAA